MDCTQTKPTTPGNYLYRIPNPLTDDDAQPTPVSILWRVIHGERELWVRGWSKGYAIRLADFPGFWSEPFVGG